MTTAVIWLAQEDKRDGHGDTELSQGQSCGKPLARTSIREIYQTQQRR